MPWNALILPLLGGYYFLTRCIYFKHDSRRTERQRLIFDSAFAGTILLILSYLVCFLLKYTISKYFQNFHIPGLGISFIYTSLGAFLLGLILAHEVFAKFVREGESLEDSKIRTVISEGDILSATIFDLDHYKEFKSISAGLVLNKFLKLRHTILNLFNPKLR